VKKWTFVDRKPDAGARPSLPQPVAYQTPGSVHPVPVTESFIQPPETFIELPERLIEAPERLIEAQGSKAEHVGRRLMSMNIGVEDRCLKELLTTGQVFRHY
jgi:hypothetical protein